MNLHTNASPLQCISTHKCTPYECISTRMHLHSNASPLLHSNEMLSSPHECICTQMHLHFSTQTKCSPLHTNASALKSVPAGHQQTGEVVALGGRARSRRLFLLVGMCGKLRLSISLLFLFLLLRLLLFFFLLSFPSSSS